MDTPGAMELTSKIWEGEDYIPHVWGDWLADPYGQLTIAEYGGKIVGIGKLTRITETQWWLEGLRVHPDYEGRGIASRLHDYHLGLWKRSTGKILRLATNSIRYPVHHLCERTGFHKVGEFALYTAPVTDLTDNTFTPLTSSGIQAASEVALTSPAYQLSFGLFDLLWQWASLENAFLAEAVRRERAWWWKGKRGLLISRDDFDHDQKPLPYLQLLACSIHDIADMLLGYRSLAARLGFDQAGWIAPLHPDLLPLLESTGFIRRWETAIFIFELKAG
jgi:GNAT superfamily N-acetyltransferase